MTSLAQTCPQGARRLPPSSCLQVRPNSATYDASLNSCQASGLTGLLAISEDGQFTNLVSYAEVLVPDGEVYWLGYKYEDASTLRDSQGNIVAAGPIVESGNYGSGNNQAPDSGVCIAISGDGELFRRSCNEEYPSFCYQFFQGEVLTHSNWLSVNVIVLVAESVYLW